MRSRRAVVGLASLGLALSACTGGPSGEGDGPDASASAPEAAETTPPTPAEELGLTTGWGPSARDLDRAARAVRGMPLPDLAGQVIVAEWRGTAAPVDLVRDLHLGGVIAFADNVASAAQIRAVNDTLTRTARRDWPLFLSVDQEGGIVERVKGDATRFPAFMSAGAADRPGLTRSTYRASGAELRGMGFTVDFAPDADVTSGPGDPTIGSRSVGSDAATVGTHVSAAVDGMVEAGLVPVIKHFPGHGSVPADSHETLPVQTRTRDQLDAVDLAPFAAAVEAGVPAVMVGHIDVRAVDPRVPSSMSRKVVTGILRDELGFSGLVVTDSLSMAGVRATRGPAESAVQALRAGNDVVLMPPSPQAARAGIVSAVRTGRLSRSRLEQAAARQIALLLHTAGTRGAAPGSARASSRALSAAAVTVASGPCRGRLVGSAVTPYGDPVAVANFLGAAGAAGLGVLLRRLPPASLTQAQPAPDRGKRERRAAFRKRHLTWERRDDRRRRALAAWERAEDDRLAAGTSVAFTGYGDAGADGEIAVATDTPYVLGSVTAPVRIATYGDTAGAMSALVDVLVGRAKAPGRLPVEVPGVERAGC
jgi:beta-N-acetylhexosaminidase